MAPEFGTPYFKPLNLSGLFLWRTLRVLYLLVYYLLVYYLLVYANTI